MRGEIEPPKWLFTPRYLILVTKLATDVKGVGEDLYGSDSIFGQTHRHQLKFEDFCFCESRRIFKPLEFFAWVTIWHKQTKQRNRTISTRPIEILKFVLKLKQMTLHTIFCPESVFTTIIIIEIWQPFYFLVSIDMNSVEDPAAG